MQQQEYLYRVRLKMVRATYLSKDINSVHNQKYLPGIFSLIFLYIAFNDITSITGFAEVKSFLGSR